MRRPLLVRGGKVIIGERELGGVPVRLGLVVRIERGSYGFEVVVMSGAEDDGVSGEPCYQGEIRDVWGRVPCV